MTLKAAVISDIHLGSCSSRPRDVLRFLESLDTEVLIVNGDLLDNFPTRSLTSEEWEVLAALHTFNCNGTNDDKVVWLKGNHDSTADKVAESLCLPFLSTYNVYVGEKRIHVCHGHYWDPAYSEGKYSFWTPLGNLFESLVGIFSLRARVWWRRKRREFFRCDLQLKEGAYDLLSSGQYDAVICGHTHWPEDSYGYFNSGSWCQTDNTWIAIHSDGRITLEVFE